MAVLLDPYERIIFRGRVFDRATANALMDVEEVLGYPLTVLQAVGGAPASKGAHLGKNGEGGRAVDITDNDGDAKDRAMKDCGFFGWQRPELPGVWGPHGHYGLILFSRSNRRGMADLLSRQLDQYDVRLDGLTTGFHDGSYRADPKVVYSRANYREDVAPPMNDVEKVRDSLLRARNHLGNAIAQAKDAEGREVVQGQVPWMKEKRAEITDRLEHMPKR
jgi:hypothetical protein